MKNKPLLPKSIEERVIHIVKRDNLISTINDEGVMQGVILKAIAEESELMDKIMGCQDFQNASKRYTMETVYNSFNSLKTPYNGLSNSIHRSIILFY